MISLYAVVTSPLQHLHLLLLERRFGQTLTSEVAKFSSQGDILLTGDFNARTGVLPEYSEHDSHKYISLPLNYKLDSSQMRCNADYSIVLVAISIYNNRRIGRDRNVGDFTCYTPRGCSVVDYFIASECLMNYISDMSVYGPSENLNHCPTILSITLQVPNTPSMPIPTKSFQLLTICMSLEREYIQIWNTPPPHLMCKCFDALITPIIEYESQLWDHHSTSQGEIWKLKRYTAENFVILYSMYYHQL